MFKPILQSCIDHYRPSAIVMQCGADSLANDRLGSFNLTLNGHGDCVQTVASYGLPTLFLGGGGYTPRNVSKCWTYETALLAGTQLSEEIPYNGFYEFFGPDYTLSVLPSNCQNMNTDRQIEDKVRMVTERLRSLPNAPGVAHGRTNLDAAPIAGKDMFSDSAVAEKRDEEADVAMD
ncbi:histone deacetylase superfamily protein [Kipferlia bialata]|nr:histone deacetylase superfamily protein [Kipferlia bialata]|eukprot:g3086.t1